MANTPHGIPLTPDSVKISKLAAADRAMAVAIDGLLSGDLTPELEAAARIAVSSQLAYVDILKGSDNRVMRHVDSSNYALPIPDEAGNVSGGVQTDGTWNFARPPRIGGVSGMTMIPIINNDWALPFVDTVGHVAGGINRRGEATFKKLVLNTFTALKLANEMAGFTRSLRNAIACFGDSLTNGYFGGSSGHTADAYPAKLQALVPAGVSVYNVSTSGWAVDEVAARIGAIPLPLTAAGNSIPASGPVTVTTTAVIGWGTGARTFNGTLAGVPGQLVRAVGGTYTFTRTTAGAVVPCPAGTIYVTDHRGHDAETAVIFLGRNDVAQGITGAESTVAEHISAGVSRIVDWLSRDIKQVVVVSVTTSTGERFGTTGHTTVTTANDLLRALYPSRFLDLRRYLVDQAIYDLGITPTPADVDNMIADTLPPSIMDPGAAGTGDGTHYSKATAELVAAQINLFTTAREWIKP